MHRDIRIFKLLVSIITILFLVRCAQIGTISGGPKDETPPKMVSSTPPNYATNFKEKKIKIDFDEYIALKEIENQFNISPPLKKKPKIWIKDKSVIVQYTDTLLDTTTYTLSFGNAIVDNNEGNVLQNFEFVFSTGPYLDSLGIWGSVVDAFTLKPSKNPVLVMLYNNLLDSAVYSERPLYTGRTDKDGNFTINNVKPGKYRLYAITDLNFNFKYDPQVEFFAFYDSVINLYPTTLGKTDSVHLQHMIDDFNKNETVKKDREIDSAKLRNIKNSIHADIRMFVEKDKKQYIKYYDRPDRRQLIMKFNTSLIDDSISLLPLFVKPVESWFLMEPLRKNSDSLIFWLTDTTLINLDTIRLAIGYKQNLPFKITSWKTDTILFRFLDKDVEKRKKTLVQTMQLKLTINEPMDLNSQIIIETQYPISEVNHSNIEFFIKTDTVYKPINFELEQDSFSTRMYYLKNKWQPSSNYQIKIYPHAFNSIYHLTCDTIIKTFTTRLLEYYGTLHLNLVNFSYPIIVQLVGKDSEKPEYEQYVTKPNKITFEYVQPKEYRLKIIFDTDGNKEYTTGDFLLHRQPEKVLYYNDLIKMRSNWETEINWELK